MATTIRGGCMCGAVTYSAEVDDPSAMSCYCKDCQNATGSSCATFLPVSEAALKQVGSPKSYAKKGESGKDVTRYFCGDCGSQLYSAVEVVPGALFVKIGSLANADSFAPQVHIWTGSRPSWVELPKGAPAFEKNPES